LVESQDYPYYFIPNLERTKDNLAFIHLPQNTSEPLTLLASIKNTHTPLCQHVNYTFRGILIPEIPNVKALLNGM